MARLIYCVISALAMNVQKLIEVKKIMVICLILWSLVYDYTVIRKMSPDFLNFIGSYFQSSFASILTGEQVHVWRC